MYIKTVLKTIESNITLTFAYIFQYLHDIWTESDISVKGGGVSILLFSAPVYSIRTCPGVDISCFPVRVTCLCNRIRFSLVVSFHVQMVKCLSTLPL